MKRVFIFNSEAKPDLFKVTASRVKCKIKMSETSFLFSFAFHRFTKYKALTNDKESMQNQKTANRVVKEHVLSHKRASFAIQNMLF